jgi:two-component system chemotaxis sensor kinase CheA
MQKSRFTPEIAPSSDSTDAARQPQQQAIDPLILAALAEYDVAPAAQTAGTEGALDARRADGIDRDLLDGFVAECGEHLQQAEESLLQLEHGFDEEAVNRVFRCFHTIKGTGAFLGLERISELAHRAESLMSKVRDRTIELKGRPADLVLSSIDMIDTLVRSVGKPRVPGSGPAAGFQELMRALADAASGTTLDSGESQLNGPAPAWAAATREAARISGINENGAFTRVRTDRLDELIKAIRELVSVHALLSEDKAAQPGDEERGRRIAHAGRIARELQDLGMAMRMVPVKSLFQKLTRLCRDTAKRSGKDVAFVTEGEDTELDRNMVDVIGDPLVHMVRNAVDHGIESPAERERAGKPRQGVVRLSARRAGGSVVVTLSDDGRGLDVARIVATAVSRGIVEQGHTLTDIELHELIFTPGLTTVETVTEVSGRGVGMDVVRRGVQALHGECDIASEPGRGLTLTIRLPLSPTIGRPPERLISQSPTGCRSTPVSR